MPCTCVYLCRAPQTELRFGEKVAMQHQFALQVLQRAYREIFNLNLDELNLRRLPSNKLVCDSGHFSISHSGNFVAVAVSDKPVGVDIQKYNGEKVLDVAKNSSQRKKTDNLPKATTKLTVFTSFGAKKRRG